MNVGSLFSGAGGTALGFKRAGFKHSWFVEIDPYAQALLRKNFPKASVYGDITKIDFRTVQPIDVLEGGFPCQDISNAGKRAGITGSRSSLWKYFFEAIRILRPKYVSIENVAALRNRGLDVVLSDLASIGYDAEWHCIPASAIGTHHTRDRVWIICYPNNNGQSTSEEQQSTIQRVQCDEEREEQACESSGSNSEQSQLETITGRKTYGFSSEWLFEPEFCRMVDGLPNRIHRIRCLGNAVVPQNAEVIAKAILSENIKDL